MINIAIFYLINFVVDIILNLSRSFMGKVSTGLVSMIRVLGALPVIR